MAHVALEHVDTSLTETRQVAGEDVAVFRASQEEELQADRFGLELQIRSLPDETQLVNGLASAIYFVHIMALLDLRLALLAHLVDYTKWKIAYTHPPALQRVLNLMGKAEALCPGTGAGLQKVHESLEPVSGLLFETANKQQEEVLGAALSLVGRLVADHKASGDIHSKQESLPGDLPPEVSEELLRLFNRSPLGVMRALEPTGPSEYPAIKEQCWSLVTNQLALLLPPEFQRFRGQTPAERARELA